MKYEQAKPLIDKLVPVVLLYHGSSMLREKLYAVLDEHIPDLDDACFERGCPAIDSFAAKENK